MSEKPDISIQPHEIHWRVGSTYEKGGTKYGMLLGYIDARDAMAKLDVLDPQWSSRMEPVQVGADAGVRCTLTVNGVSREDVGVPSDTEGLKGAFSDALKRAAVHFGIGRELYDLPTIAVECEVRPNGKVGRPKALPQWNGRQWTIESGLGWVRYDTPPKPVEQGGQGEAGDGRAKPHVPAAPAHPQYRRAELAQLAKDKGLSYKALEDYAALIGVQPGAAATNEQMDRLIEAVQGHGTDAVIERPEPAASPPGDAAPADPPRPGTDEYRALPVGDKAKARAYWAQRDAEDREPEPMNPEQTVLPVEAA